MARSPNRDKAFEIFKDHNGDITNRKIAEMLDEKEKTISAWKSRDKWAAKLSGQDCSTTKTTQQNKRSTTKRKGGNKPALKGNNYAAGNRGNRKPKYGNSNAVTHGLLRKVIPTDDEEAVKLLEEIENHDELDMLWSSIHLQYFNIMNSQRIMHVRDKDDKSEEISGVGDGSTSYKIDFAHEKQANLLQAYSKAMTSLSNLIKRFVDMAHADDERLLKLTQMQLSIDKTKAETEFAELRAKQLRGQTKDTSLLDALIEGRKQYEQNRD